MSCSGTIVYPLSRRNLSWLANTGVLTVIASAAVGPNRWYTRIVAEVTSCDLFSAFDTRVAVGKRGQDYDQDCERNTISASFDILANIRPLTRSVLAGCFQSDHRSHTEKFVAQSKTGSSRLPISGDLPGEHLLRETHLCALHRGSLRAAQNHVRKVRETRRTDADGYSDSKRKETCRRKSGSRSPNQNSCNKSRRREGGRKHQNQGAQYHPGPIRPGPYQPGPTPT